MATIKKAQNGVVKSSKPAPKPTAKPAEASKPKPKTVSQKIGDITLRDIKNAGEDALNLSTLGMYRKAKKKVKEVTGLKNGGSVSAGTKGQSKRVGSVDPKGAYTKVQKRTLAGAKGKASLTKDKQLGATRMAKCGAKMSKKK
jgi:hypothetical protein